MKYSIQHKIGKKWKPVRGFGNVNRSFAYGGWAMMKTNVNKYPVCRLIQKGKKNIVIDSFID